MRVYRYTQQVEKTRENELDVLRDWSVTFGHFRISIGSPEAVEMICASQQHPVRAALGKLFN